MTTSLALRTVTSYGRSAGSARVRVFDWLDHLGIDAVTSDYIGTSSNGIGVLGRHAAATARAEARLRRLPAAVRGERVLLSRQASPFSNGRIEAAILSSAAHGVYDFDDALMHSPPGSLDRFWSKRRVWQAATAAADLVIAGNDYLAERAAAVNGNVTVIPSCVEPDDYVRKADYESGETPRAVWLGTPSTESYLARIEGALLAAHRARGLRLTLISAGDRPLGALEAMTDRVDWTLAGFAGHLVDADFGIMPLDDSPWTRGKCAYKLLQYGAAALPMIADPVGANAAVLAAGDGMAVESDAAWADAMIAMIDEPATARAARGAAARSAIESRYSFTAWADAWRTAVLG